MSYSGIYELTEFQATNLIVAASGKVASFAVIEPAEGDDPEIKEKLQRYMKEAEALVQQGLAEDVSAELGEALREKSKEANRGIKVFALTESAYLLFGDATERVAN